MKTRKPNPYPTRLWSYMDKQVAANTKSEARALFKKLFGIRLPDEIVVREVRKDDQG